MKLGIAKEQETSGKKKIKVFSKMNEMILIVEKFAMQMAVLVG